MDVEHGTDRRFATTLARGLAVLRAFHPGDDGLSNTELAKRTGLPKSTVSRLTHTLRELGYLTHARRNDRYRPGPALMVLGATAAASISFIDLAEPIMRRLADETGTMAMLLVRDRDKMLIVRAWRPRGVASLWLEVGHRVPLQGSSSGHAFLTARGPSAGALSANDAQGLPDGERVAAIVRDGARQLSERGFLIADPTRYFAPGIHAVAVPFRSRDLSEPVVLTCGALPDVLTVERMETEVGPALREAVGELNRLVGNAHGFAVVPE